MANSKIGIIITREFNERVRKKSFIVTTILMPVLMIGLMVAPALIMRYSQGETRHISVIDESGVIAPRLESSEEVVYEPTDLTLDEARREHTDRFGILWIGGDITVSYTKLPAPETKADNGCRSFLGKKKQHQTTRRERVTITNAHKQLNEIE